MHYLLIFVIIYWALRSYHSLNFLLPKFIATYNLQASSTKQLQPSPEPHSEMPARPKKDAHHPSRRQQHLTLYKHKLAELLDCLYRFIFPQGGAYGREWEDRVVNWVQEISGFKKQAERTCKICIFTQIRYSYVLPHNVPADLVQDSKKMHMLPQNGIFHSHIKTAMSLEHAWDFGFEYNRPIFPTKH